MPQRSPRGTYLQIADALRVKLGDGSQQTELPSEAELMKTYGVARSTVKRALEVLAGEGLIRSQPGVGWLVAADQAAKVPVLDQITALLGPDRLQVGDSIPSENDLTTLTGASRGTVRRALATLEGAGILEARHGKGRYVRALPPTKESPPQPA
ncbi:GntR family transcriptional regulator [Kitasatospora sp. NPDC056138]|uniref:GntR family transcriptional regulator n=1 Tax=Kitasatospora sp. NPDC056138 TaxID=3345724 RepID=UPI0035D5A2C9